MIDIGLDILSWVLLTLGGACVLIGGIGGLRLPDFYTRSHAASITDTLGATLILVGLAIHSGINLISVKLGIVLFLLYVTNPTATHALVKAAFAKGLKAPDLEDISLTTGTSAALAAEPEGGD